MKLPSFISYVLLTTCFIGLGFWGCKNSSKNLKTRPDTSNSLALKTAQALPPGFKKLIAPRYSYQIVHTYPHDPEAFTQGLLYAQGYLYESTGRRGHSSLRKVELTTGKVLKQTVLPARYFGEGLALCQNRFYQLTWESGTAFIYDLQLKKIGQLYYSGEGWGITWDGENLILSDGSPRLYWREPETLLKTRQVIVKEKGSGRPVPYLNELELYHHKILANIWLTYLVAIIEPDTGTVEGWLDLNHILTPSEAKYADVLNGIAYDRSHDRLFVTGKLWPKLFEIKIYPPLETTPPL